MRNEHPWTKTFFVCLIAQSVFGCRGGERPFLQVQFCLTEAAGANELKQVLQEIAREEGLVFGDRSAEAEAEMRALGDAVPLEVRRSVPVINVSVRRGDVGLGGGNMGLGADQVALGFGPDSAEERAFATRAVQRLQQTWKLVRVPNDRGAFRLKECPMSG